MGPANKKLKLIFHPDKEIFYHKKMFYEKSKKILAKFTESFH